MNFSIQYKGFTFLLVVGVMVMNYDMCKIHAHPYLLKRQDTSFISTFTPTPTGTSFSTDSMTFMNALPTVSSSMYVSEFLTTVPISYSFPAASTPVSFYPTLTPITSAMAPGRNCGGMTSEQVMSMYPKMPANCLTGEQFCADRCAFYTCDHGAYFVARSVSLGTICKPNGKYIQLVAAT
ncbi:hypothetical protein HMI54_009329 [Coelomomyces lativittatus]|nr:hypothetical protein HMI54_009329 [Coelomomyces lativittatus]KAJ1502623.1 hypothetical protein HMI56_002595 [Coelomomyces lativittatus]KAJ1507781.1 hypothetical protein HMI55_000636 [Coelomomyces lativittatus]